MNIPSGIIGIDHHFLPNPGIMWNWPIELGFSSYFPFFSAAFAHSSFLFLRPQNLHKRLGPFPPTSFFLIFFFGSKCKIFLHFPAFFRVSFPKMFHLNLFSKFSSIFKIFYLTIFAPFGLLMIPFDLSAVFSFPKWLIAVNVKASRSSFLPSLIHSFFVGPFSSFSLFLGQTHPKYIHSIILHFHIFCQIINSIPLIITKESQFNCTEKKIKML